LFFSLLLSGSSVAQLQGFSLATDLGIQRNFKPEQQFWAFGQTVHLHFHLTRRDGIYTWFAYFSNGKFHNDLAATAKSPSTAPATIPFINNASMRIKSFSVGWKKYLKGSFDAEKKWNLYAFAGFGLVPGRVINTQNVSIDTANYTTPVLNGRANFKRLTLDLGLGVEFPVGGDFFLYTEVKTLIPASDYPSKYIFINNNAPFTGMLSGGLRLLF
jgi:hypothetical protein